MNTIQYLIDQKPNSENSTFLRDKIVDFNAHVIHERASQFNVYAQNSNGNIIGGALIWEHSDALYLDILWIEESYRNKGIGSALMNKIFAQANLKNTKKIFVDTFDFQAMDFYIKQGFYVIGKIEDYLLGHARIFLRKNLHE